MKSTLKIISGIVIGAVATITMVSVAPVKYKSLKVTDGAYALVKFYAKEHKSSLQETASLMIRHFRPTIHTTFFSSKSQWIKGVNNLQAYLEGWDILEYTMYYQIDSNSPVKMTQGLSNPYIGYVKNIDIDTTLEPTKFVLTITALDLKGSKLAERFLTIENR